MFHSQTKTVHSVKETQENAHKTWHRSEQNELGEKQLRADQGKHEHGSEEHMLRSGYIAGSTTNLLGDIGESPSGPLFGHL